MYLTVTGLENHVFLVILIKKTKNKPEIYISGKYNNLNLNNECNRR